MSWGDLEFAGPGALDFCRRGLRYDWPADWDADSQAALRHENTGVVLIAALDRARRGDRSGLPALIGRCTHDDHPYISTESYFLLGMAASPGLLCHLLEQERSSIYETAPPSWWRAECAARALIHSGSCWTIPVVLDLYLQVAETRGRSELGNVLSRLETTLSPEYGSKLYSAYESRRDEVVVQMALELWRPLQDRYGPHERVCLGAPIDLRALAEQIRDRGRSPTSLSWQRRRYEAATGIDCSSWFNPDRRPRLLQAAAEADRFLREDAHRFLPGERYFAGHHLVDVNTPEDEAAIQAWSQGCEARVMAWLAARTKTSVSGSGSEADEDDEDDEPLDLHEYRYAAYLDDPADPEGDCWSRLSAAVQDATLGEFDGLVPAVLAALERAPVDDQFQFDYDAASLIADAAPLSQLRAMVETLRPRLVDEPCPRWRELTLLALANSRLPWALSAAFEIFTALHAQPGFEPRYLRSWTYFQDALAPLAPMQALRERTRVDLDELRARLHDTLDGHPPGQALWRGEPLRLSTLVDELAVELEADEPRADRIYRLRQLLEASTAVELQGLWATPEVIDRGEGLALVDALRALELVRDHEPGQRLFAGSLIPD